MAALVGPGAELVVPLDAGAERMAVLVLGSRISDKLVRAGGARSWPARSRSPPPSRSRTRELVEQLHSAATTDELTGLYNRRALEERLAAEISRSLRHQLHTSVLLLDLDRFKVVNDTMGHAAGDRLLVQVARRCSGSSAARSTWCGRLGGDEFLVILPMTKPAEAQVFVAPGAGQPARASRSQPGVRRLHPEHGHRRVAPARHDGQQRAGRRRHRAVQRQARRGRNTVEVAEG